jgi:hypothetical protein
MREYNKNMCKMTKGKAHLKYDKACNNAKICKASMKPPLTFVKNVDERHQLGGNSP